MFLNLFPHKLFVQSGTLLDIPAQCGLTRYTPQYEKLPSSQAPGFQLADLNSLMTKKPALDYSGVDADNDDDDGIRMKNLRSLVAVPVLSLAVRNSFTILFTRK
jgi:hypothetical protein